MPGTPGPDSTTVREFVWTADRILFEDDWLLVVDKPAGLPTDPTVDKTRPSVSAGVREFLKQRDGTESYLGTQHRLDRDTSGVLLFSRDPKANRSLSSLFATRAVRKTYLALTTAGTPCPDAWDVENYLGVVGQVGRCARQGAVRSGGDPAHTSFRVLERLRNALLVEARPHTGRTHQIRAHLAECGHPIYGDTLYGGPTRWGPAPDGQDVTRVLLHAASLEFTHPATGAELNIRSPLPPDFTARLATLRLESAAGNDGSHPSRPQPGGG